MKPQSKRLRFPECSAGGAWLLVPLLPLLLVLQAGAWKVRKPGLWRDRDFQTIGSAGFLNVCLDLANKPQIYSLVSACAAVANSCLTQVPLKFRLQKRNGIFQGASSQGSLFLFATVAGELVCSSETLLLIIKTICIIIIIKFSCVERLHIHCLNYNTTTL